MSPENFVYWLKGYFEVSQHSDSPKTLNEKQVEEIQNHLNLVLTKVTTELSSPKVGKPNFLEQFKIDEEERKKEAKKTQPYFNPNREPGRAC